MFFHGPLSSGELLEYIRGKQMSKIDNISLMFFLFGMNEELLQKKLTNEEIVRLENYIVSYKHMGLITQWMDVYPKNNCNIPEIVMECEDGNDLVLLFLQDKSYYRVICEKLLELNDFKGLATYVWYSYGEEFASKVVQYILDRCPQHLTVLYEDLSKRSNELDYLPDEDIAMLYNPPGKEITITTNIDPEVIRECKEYAHHQINYALSLLDEHTPYDFKHYALGVML